MDVFIIIDMHCGVIELPSNVTISIFEEYYIIIWSFRENFYISFCQRFSHFMIVEFQFSFLFKNQIFELNRWIQMIDFGFLFSIYFNKKIRIFKFLKTNGLSISFWFLWFKMNLKTLNWLMITIFHYRIKISCGYGE